LKILQLTVWKSCRIQQ